MEKLIFTADESSFIVEAEGKKLRVSYDEFCGNHEDAMKFCEEHNGGDESLENLRFIAKHRDAINVVLKKHGKEPIKGWYWSNVAWWDDGLAFVVSTGNGDVDNDCRDCTYDARAISVV